METPNCVLPLVISIHAPRTGSDAGRKSPAIRRWHFNPRSPHGERPAERWPLLSELQYFNPRSPHGERRYRMILTGTPIQFQSTLPARGATWAESANRKANQDFNPRSPHGERRRLRLPRHAPGNISIHAPRTGSDQVGAKVGASLFLFQSTLPARGATRAPLRRSRRCPFQSTLPARGATGFMGNPAGFLRHFNPRSPHGERRDPRMGSKLLCKFQSTLPARGATLAMARHDNRRDFNPRSPHGERPDAALRMAAAMQFQSTLPARGATYYLTPYVCGPRISIHAPRTGSDKKDEKNVDAKEEFQSTLPARGATNGALSASSPSGEISIHAPRTGSDAGIAQRYYEAQFQSTLPARGATGLFDVPDNDIIISIHAPRTGSDVL